MKIIKLNESIDNLLLLSESTLNKVANGHDNDGYAMISACRQDALTNYKNYQQVIDENNKRTAQLKQDLIKNKLSYIPVYGGYREDNQDKFSIEKSFIVFPYDRISKQSIDFNLFQDKIIELGKKWNQDSVLIKFPKGVAKYYNCKNDTWDNMSFSNVSMNDLQQDYFTALKKWKDSSLNKKERTDWIGKPQRFTYVETYMDYPPQSVMEATRRRNNYELFTWNN